MLSPRRRGHRGPHADRQLPRQPEGDRAALPRPRAGAAPRRRARSTARVARRRPLSSTGLDAPLRRARRARRRHADAAGRARRSSSSAPTARASRRCCACSPRCCARTRARARVLGRELPDEGWAVRGRIGLLGHEPLLYRDLSARENLRFHARLHGVAARARRGAPRARRPDARAPTTRSTPTRAGWSSACRGRARGAARPRAAAARRAARQPRPGAPPSWSSR